MKGRGLFEHVGKSDNLPGLSSIPLPQGDSVALEHPFYTIASDCAGYMCKQNTETIGDLAS